MPGSLPASSPGWRQPYTAATVALDRAKLDVAEPTAATPADWRGATDAAVERLLGQGYRATLTQTILAA